MNFTQKGLLSLIGKLSSTLIALLISVLLARLLGVEGVGRYQLFLSSQTVLITILAMGFGNATIFFINSKNIEQKILVSNLFKLFRVIAITLSIIFGFSIYIFHGYFGNLKPISILFFSIGSGGLLIYNVLMPVFYAKMEIVKLQILSLSSAIFLVIGILIVNLFLGNDLDAILLLVGISNLVSTLILFYFLREDIKFSEKMNYLLLKDIFKYGIKISATNFVFILSTNLVIFLINKLLANGFEAVGLFSRATAITNMFLMFPTTLGPLFYSKWSGIAKENLHLEIEKVMRLMFSFSILCAIFTCVFGKWILGFLYGPKFIGAETTLSILSFSILFSSITIVFTNYFSSIGKPSVILKVFVISLIITFAFSLFLIPLFGIEGAAFSVLLGLIYNVFVLTIQSAKISEISIKNSLIITKKDLIQLKNVFEKK